MLLGNLNIIINTNYINKKGFGKNEWRNNNIAKY